MNNNIRVRKFVFNEKVPKIKLTDEERLKFLETSKKLLIQILEIEAANPSDLVLVVTTESMGSRRENPIYLFSYRDKMIFQDGKYIVRLDCVVETAVTFFELEIVSDTKKPFINSAYYSVH